MKLNLAKHHWLFAGTIIVSLLVYMFGPQYLMMTSVLNYAQHDPFDGTTYPIKKAPDYVHLTTDERTKTYSELDSSKLLDMPKYDADQLTVSTDSLKWNNATDDKIRNAKITYAVPYMGNYKLDGKENAGSHAAVDIKIPKGTPVYAIANGVVTVASTQTNGFGNHIVLMHRNFPTLEDANAKTTIYSSYSHMSAVLVSTNQVVKKGEQIGLSGDTGTATTPHLHFQIDTDEADWHPFWPFTSAEVNAAGLNFFSAINEGLGRENALKTTIHPMKYVQKYLNVTSAGSYVNNTEEEPVEENTEDVKEVVDEETPVVEEVEEITATEPPVLKFEFAMRPTYYNGQTSNFSILLRDQYGNVYDKGFDGEITVQAVDGKVTVDKAIVDAGDFDGDGKLQTDFKKMVPGKDKLLISYNGQKYYSDEFAIEDSGSEKSFTDVPTDHEYHEAIIYLAEQGVINGYPDGTFKPGATVSRVEALKFILEGIKASLDGGDLPFKDTSSKEWYAKYLYTAYKNKVVDGYSDGRFKPAGTVNKAEFYKMLFNGMGVTVDSSVSEDPADDVKASDWFAPYIAKAKSMGVMQSDIRTVRPANGMSRGEVAEAIYRLMTVVK